ncbi:hypothetical protein YTPLAS18_17420 [Nitrospira sp.]|nr:hypothetical protein YTPLAS18_17420 [Nitrospira sp.]
MMKRAIGCLSVGLALVLVWDPTFLVQAQAPETQPYGYGRPPQSQSAPDTSVPQNTQPLSEEELKRAEALLPMLEGKQEYWAMGEFVHLGLPVVPVLIKALNMPGPRARYNAIETIAMLKATEAVPALLEHARQPNEMPRIREHALRTAIRLDSARAAETLAVMAKDAHDSVRKAAAFEARYVRHRDVVPMLIDLLSDDERYVAISAIQSLWLLTRHESEMHDWETSSKADREEWSQEWREWWSSVKDAYEMPQPTRSRSSSS